MSATLSDLIRAAARELDKAGVEDPGREARLLAAYAARISLSRLVLVQSEPVSQQISDHFDRAVAQRVARVPLSHITGRRAFYNHEFAVTPDVLDPRADTEILVDTALEGAFEHVLDLGTGSGCILLSLLADQPTVSGVGTDMSPAALDVALRNANALGVAERCLFLCCDWFDQVSGRFDLIVSNPPYIAENEMPTLSRELHHEPRMALTDGADGLSAYRTIVPGAGAHLHQGGRLAVEIGWTQSTAVTALFETSGFQDVTVKKDLEGRDRVVCGIWRG